VNPRVSGVLFPVEQMRILLVETVEHAPGQRVVLHVLDARLHLALMLRRIRLRRQKYRSVVLRERLQLRMDFRIVPVGLFYGRLEIIDRQLPGNSPEITERVFEDANEVLSRLKFPRNSKRLELVTLETTRRGVHL